MGTEYLQCSGKGLRGTGMRCMNADPSHTATLTRVSQVCTGIRSKYYIIYIFILQILFYKGGKSHDYAKDFIRFWFAHRPLVFVWSGPPLGSFSPPLPPHSLIVSLSLSHSHRSHAVSLSLSRRHPTLALLLSPVLAVTPSLSRSLALSFSLSRCHRLAVNR